MNGKMFAAYRAALHVLLDSTAERSGLEGLEYGLFYGLDGNPDDIAHQLMPPTSPGAPWKTPQRWKGIKAGIGAGLWFRQRFGPQMAEHESAELSHAMEHAGGWVTLEDYQAKPYQPENFTAPPHIVESARLVDALAQEDVTMPEAASPAKAAWQRDIKRLLANLRVAYLTADGFEREEALQCARILMSKCISTQGVCDE